MDVTVPSLAFIYNVFKDIVKLSSSRLILKEDSFVDSFHKHLAHIETWSSRIQFTGMPSAKSTESDTLPLRISSQPRKLFSIHSKIYFSEDDLLSNRTNTILLGDPGSGKTTTVKRIVRRILHVDSSFSDFHIDFPILVIAREMVQGVTLTEHICSILGAKFDDIGIATEDRDRIPMMRREIFQAFVYKFCRERAPLIIVDGIDETSPDVRQSLEKELAQLGAIIQKGQLICTCRSGDFTRVIDGFDVCELQPLTTKEQIKIARLWANRPREFIRDARGKTYADLLNRPLYLVQIIMIYNTFGNLPERPSEVYRRVVTLVLERWDRERLISRRTNYSGFSVEQRLDFISCIAFNLTFRKRLSSFSEDDIVSIYISIHKKYLLPESECLEVVREIESHSGLIVEGSFSRFEFSHLSVQEYLAACHVVLQPSIRNVISLFFRYSPPFAIATCISADHSSYFAQLIFSCYLSENWADARDPLVTFLHRLQLERPIFDESADFGLSLIMICSILDRNDLNARQTKILQDFFHFALNIMGERSVRNALRFYILDNSTDCIRLSLRKELFGNVAHYPRDLTVGILFRRLLPFV